jgi:hypothetical protein
MRQTPAESQAFKKFILKTLPKAKSKAMPISALAKALGYKDKTRSRLTTTLVKLRESGDVLTVGEKAKMAYYRK